ncbi:MAG: 50S ribosomal protein L29 [Bdellovibrionales bacterium]|nr:50S ribosomal protein L29 [Bdellovibrionales bacterium]
MKRSEEIKELRGLEVSGLTEKVQSLKEELMRLRFRKAAGQLETSARLKEVRRSIARAETVITEKNQQSAA